MSIDLDVVGRPWSGGTVSWSSSQALLYALGVGAGGSAEHDELAFTTENSRGEPQRVLPTFAAVLAMQGGTAPASATSRTCCMASATSPSPSPSPRSCTVRYR